MSRVILKISGEALKGDNNLVSESKLKIVLKTIELLKQEHNEVGIVIGGGNYFRGREHQDMDKVTADTIGMLGTIMNALYLKDYLIKNNIEALVTTPFSFPNLLKDYQNEEINTEFNKGKVIIFGGGIGKSGYSTDSGVVLAALTLGADLIIKMTNVDGVYSEDPKINPKAIKYDYLTYQEVIKKDLKVMDIYAIEECQKNNIKILVMNFNEYEKITEYFRGAKVGSLIGE